MANQSIKPGDSINYKIDVLKKGIITGAMVLPATVIHIDRRRQRPIYISGDGFTGYIDATQICDKTKA